MSCALAGGGSGLEQNKSFVGCVCVLLLVFLSLGVPKINPKRPKGCQHGAEKDRKGAEWEPESIKRGPIWKLKQHKGHQKEPRQPRSWSKYTKYTEYTKYTRYTKYIYKLQKYKKYKL